MRMQDKVAVVTGGASGIGRRTTERFVEEGGRVVIADRDEASGLRLAAALGDAARFVRCDVVQEADVATAIGFAPSVWGRLDLVFCNAGAAGDPNPIETISAEGWDATMHLLLRSVMLGIKHAVAVMKPQGYGAIVATASIAGVVPGSTPPAYAVAKAAVIHLTKCAAVELAPHRIRVNCICPGAIATPIFSRRADLPSQTLDRVTEEIAGALTGFQPIARAGRPEDIAEAVLYLADDRAGFVTGVALPVDGGFAAGLTAQQREALWRPVRMVVHEAAARGSAEPSTAAR
ncbi:MAG TPA: glucose 1-dehydrogenase [Acetobacteraceae bacterium]|jgi:NAD(P)-dependent dehydrogenase (short-subunit alcohol dehydrogenase family)|nr:glucose 1-dehydrogenase [Acetobacteraceae bacterium]